LFGQDVKNFDNLFIGREQECVESDLLSFYCQLILKVEDVNYI